MEEISANYIIEIKAILTEARSQAYKAINMAMVNAYNVLCWKNKMERSVPSMAKKS